MVGSYTPAQNTFSATVYRVNSTPGRASWACPAGTTEADQPYFAVYEGPLFEDAFRELRRAPDGSLKSNGERTVSVGESTCTTTYALTLYGCGSHMPEHGMIYARTLGGRIHSEPSSNSSVIGSPPSGTRMRYTSIRQVDGQSWYYVRPAGRPEGWFSGNQVSCGPLQPTPPTLRVLPIEEMEKYEGTPGLSSAGRG